MKTALVDLINRKRSGERIVDTARPRETGNVISLMDALKRSLANEGRSAHAKDKKPRRRVEGQGEMLLPISGGGKRAAKDESKKSVKVARSTAKSRRAAR